MNAAGKKPKKLIPERLWSVEDELILLRGIVGFNGTTGKTTNEDKNGFYEFIKEYISIEVSFSQYIAKIGSLRRKYLNKVAKGKKPSSSKAQDLEAFELSETIWGSVSESRRSEKIKKLEEDKDVMIQGGDWFSSSVLVSWVVNFGMDEVSVKRLWGCVSAEKKKKKMLDRWKVLQAKDVESASQKSEFLNDVVSLIVEEVRFGVLGSKNLYGSVFNHLETDGALASSVLIQNNMARGVASSETGGVSRCLCEGQRTRKLVVFDLNGILADIVQGFTGEFVPDGKVSYRSVFRSPFVSSFLDFCFERFHVAIWSSRRIGLDYMVNIVMKNSARNLLFCFDQSKCTTTKFVTQEKNDKPLFLKDLRTLWDRFGTCISCGKRKYDETNTLLVDDSPDKALCNPVSTSTCEYAYAFNVTFNLNIGWYCIFLSFSHTLGSSLARTSKGEIDKALCDCKQVQGLFSCWRQRTRIS